MTLPKGWRGGNGAAGALLVLRILHGDQPVGKDHAAIAVPPEEHQGIFMTQNLFQSLIRNRPFKLGSLNLDYLPERGVRLMDAMRGATRVIGMHYRLFTLDNVVIGDSSGLPLYVLEPPYPEPVHVAVFAALDSATLRACP